MEKLTNDALVPLIPALLKFQLELIDSDRGRSKHYWSHRFVDSSITMTSHNGCDIKGTYQRKHQTSAVTGLCAGNSPGTGEFPAQRASYAENVSIWWRHHAKIISGISSLHLLLPLYHPFPLSFSLSFQLLEQGPHRILPTHSFQCTSSNLYGCSYRSLHVFFFICNFLVSTQALYVGRSARNRPRHLGYQQDPGPGSAG